MKNLGFDLDGVLYPWHEVIYDYLSENNLMEWDYYTFWTEKHKQFNKIFWNNLVELPFLYNRRTATENVKNLLSNLKEKFNIYYITVRPESCWTVTAKWLKDSKLPYDNKNCIFTNDKTIEVRRYDIDYLFEDKDSWIQSCKNLTTVLGIKQPWNSHIWNDEDILWFDNVIDAGNSL